MPEKLPGVPSLIFEDRFRAWILPEASFANELDSHRSTEQSIIR